MTAMNGYAKSKANTLRSKSDVPTSKKLLDYVKTLKGDEVLANAEAQAELCIKALKKKGLSTKNVAIAFDWHDAPYYGKQIAGVVGTQPKDMLRLPNCKHPNYKEEANALPPRIWEGLQELVLELMERIEARQGHFK
jgi:hypothetical protein